MNKLVIVFNGKGGVGKDTLCDALAEQYKVINISAVDPIKEIAARYGWQGEKTPKARRFLAELKRVFVEYNDLPTRYLLERYRAFEASDHEILCVHIREAEEIDKFRAGVSLPHVALLVRRREIDAMASHGNAADDGVNHYPYDVIFDNDLPVEESKKAFCALIETVLRGDR